MYPLMTKRKKLRWGYLFRHSNYFTTSNSREYSLGLQCPSPVSRVNSLTQRFPENSSTLPSPAYERRSLRLQWRNLPRRSYSSKGDGKNADDNHISDKDVFECEKSCKENTPFGSKNAHAQLGEQDQREWIVSETLAIESKKMESPFIPRRERFRNEFLQRIVPWEKINVSWDTFPYYLQEHTKNLLVECTASHLKHKKFTTDYGGQLNSSSGRILLQSIPGTELYRERLVKALARDFKVPLMVLDGSILAPYDFVEDESESDEKNSEDSSDSVIEIVFSISAPAEFLRKLLPCSPEEFEKSVSGYTGGSSTSSKPETAESSDKADRPLKKGDQVKYSGVCIKAKNRIVLGKIPTPGGPKNTYTVICGRTLSCGQRGEVYEVNGDQVAVIFDISDKAEEVKNLKSVVLAGEPSVWWLNVKDIEHDLDAPTHDCYVALEVLCEIMKSQQPLIVYFRDSSLWFFRAVSKSNRKEFIHKIERMFDGLSGPVVLICGQNKPESVSKEKEISGLKPTKRSDEDEIYKLFPNVRPIYLPKEEDSLRIFDKQIEEDRRIVISRRNLSKIHKVIEEHGFSCVDLLHVNTNDVILTKEKTEMVVGWAKNHYLSSCLLPSVRGDQLQLPRESLELTILRLKEQETASKKLSHKLKSLAEDEYEANFVSAVVPPGEIGVKFDDVGALEDVKKTLNELVILPMRRPELFSHGNLLRPCKGILLFGPPGTGKTLLAKALATEAGANFISITGSTLTSKWFGDSEKLTKALFSFASKLAPVIIFVDEVDSLLGARGGASEHEATRKMRNEFMAAWDGLRSKDSQRILILGATNRPFDLDDAVIRRLPRRIYVDLPDAENRLKILKIILAGENLESDFPFEQLANDTDGYSGSDLKNLCVASAYRPVQELLEEENKGERSGILRPLKLEDFIQSKAKVGPSVAYDAGSMNELRKWNDQYGEGGSRRKSPFGF